MKKIFACDLDGTLLNSKSEVSKNNYQAIKEFINLGHYFVISSGRPLFRVKEYIDLFELNHTSNVVMCLNGGLIIDLKTQQIIHEVYLKDDELKEILDFSKEVKLDCLVYTINQINAFMGPVSSNYVCKMKGIVDYSSKDELYKIHNVHKVIFLGTSEELGNVKQQPKYLELIKKFNIVRSTTHYLEFLPKAVSKGTGLDIIRKYLNVDLANTYGMGDEENDLELLLHSGVKITLENANPNIKKICDYITVSNDEDGVMRAIKDIILR